MRTIGFVISKKENENRRAILPADIMSIEAELRDKILIETGYGNVMSIEDCDYAATGVNICSREEAMQCDILCDPKIGDADYLSSLRKGQTIFGWIHAVQNRDITDSIIASSATAIAWEDMFTMGRHDFWRNNEIAGEAAIMHAYSLHGIFPYETRVAVIGTGNVARGAMRILSSLGAEVVQYSRRTEHLFTTEMQEFDVIVNALLWDTSRKDHIIYRSDLKRLKKDALIIDISCDRAGAIETSIPTTIENPTYVVDGVTHYVVDHTPSIFYKTISRSLSRIVASYLPQLIRWELGKVLTDALIIDKGTILDRRILEFQNRTH